MMTKAKIKITHFATRKLADRPSLSIAEAVTTAIYTASDIRADGIIERLEARVTQQNEMIARMLMVQFGEYEDHFTSPDFEPKTDVEKLGFILGPDIHVTEV